MRRSTEGPSTVVSPSSSIPSSTKNAFAASRSSTTMRTLSIRLSIMPSFLCLTCDAAYLPHAAYYGSRLRRHPLGYRQLGEPTVEVEKAVHQDSLFGGAHQPSGWLRLICHELP